MHFLSVWQPYHYTFAAGERAFGSKNVVSMVISFVVDWGQDEHKAEVINTNVQLQV